MTQQAIQDMVLANIGQQLALQSDITTRVTKAFHNWFQSLVEPPPEAAPTGAAPPEGGGGGETPA